MSCKDNNCTDSSKEKRKPVIARDPADFLKPTNTVSLFNPSRFEAAIFDKGYDVYHERAMRCPCQIQNITSPLPDCKNCGGTGWFFINKTQTRMLLSGMADKKKYEAQWSETNAGTVSISSSSLDRLAFMDRITIMCGEAYFSQVINMKYSERLDKIFAFLVYEPLEIDEIFLFKSTNEPLQVLTENEFSIQNNFLFLNKELFPIPDKKTNPLAVSVRYKHRPQYHIVDIMRDLMLTPVLNAGSNLQATIEKMPFSAMGRRAHFIFDPVDIEGNGIFDNTNRSKFPAITCHDYLKGKVPNG